MAYVSLMLNALLCLYGLEEHDTETCAKHNLRKRDSFVSGEFLCPSIPLVFLHWWQLEKFTITLNQRTDTRCHLCTSKVPWYCR